MKNFLIGLFYNLSYMICLLIVCVALIDLMYHFNMTNPETLKGPLWSNNIIWPIWLVVNGVIIFLFSKIALKTDAALDKFLRSE